jgi:F-type H+-transporting ATPase subunit g
MLNKAWDVTKKSLGPVGERLGGALGSYRAPVIYNLQVTREVLKRVYVAERLQLPHWTTFVSEYSSLWSRLRNPAFLRELVRSGEWMKVGVYAVEGYGIFKIGEILGRRSLVGYNIQ